MKVALITGASSGIGFLTAIELIKADYHVIAAMRDVNKQTELIKRIKALDKTAQLHILKLDVREEKEGFEAFIYTQKTFGKLDVLINNAGYSQGGFIDDVSIEAWTLQQETNVHGVVRMTKTFLPLLLQSDKGQIINLSSISGVLGLPGLSAYSASKFAMEGFSESIRLELLRKNIFVSLIQPASYQTEIWRKALAEINEPDMRTDELKANVLDYVQAIPKSAGDPLEVAALIVRVCRSKNPKFRYPIGKGARLLGFAKRVLPWSLLEKIIHRKLASTRKTM